MPACSNDIHPSGIKIEFFEDSHKYISNINGTKLTYISGTQFLGKFFPPFDPTGIITENCAKKEGITVEEIKKRWEKAGKESCIFGTKCHETAEDTILMQKYRNVPSNEKERKTFEVTKQIAERFRTELDILGVEKIVFNPYLPIPIAGTIDLFAKSRKDNNYLILDWKTNKKITVDNPYNKFCLAPISHLPDNEFYHYALQTSLYQYLLKFGKYVPENAKFKRAIIHLTENGYKIYQLPDLTSEIKDLIIWSSCKF